MPKGGVTSGDVARLAPQCRFRDCRHDSEPGCALLGAVESGQIHPRRWEHFRNIRSEIAAAKKLNPGW